LSSNVDDTVSKVYDEYTNKINTGKNYTYKNDIITVQNLIQTIGSRLKYLLTNKYISEVSSYFTFHHKVYGSVDYVINNSNTHIYIGNASRSYESIDFYDANSQMWLLHNNRSSCNVIILYSGSIPYIELPEVTVDIKRLRDITKTVRRRKFRRRGFHCHFCENICGYRVLKN